MTEISMILQEEARAIQMNKSKNELLTAEDIKGMKYATRVAEELIRLGNVSPFIFRRVVNDDVVINGEYINHILIL